MREFYDDSFIDKLKEIKDKNSKLLIGDSDNFIHTFDATTGQDVFKVKKKNGKIKDITSEVIKLEEKIRQERIEGQQKQDEMFRQSFMNGLSQYVYTVQNTPHHYYPYSIPQWTVSHYHSPSTSPIDQDDYLHVIVAVDGLVVDWNKATKCYQPNIKGTELLSRLLRGFGYPDKIHLFVLALHDTTDLRKIVDSTYELRTNIVDKTDYITGVGNFKDKLTVVKRLIKDKKICSKYMGYYLDVDPMSCMIIEKELPNSIILTCGTGGMK